MYQLDSVSVNVEMWSQAESTKLLRLLNNIFIIHKQETRNAKLMTLFTNSASNCSKFDSASLLDNKVYIQNRLRVKIFSASLSTLFKEALVDTRSNSVQGI